MGLGVPPGRELCGAPRASDMAVGSAPGARGPDSEGTELVAPSGPATPVELWVGEAVGAGRLPDPWEPRGASERGTHTGTRGLLPVT